MMRSLSSAVSGLRAHQTKMDVIGNNIANVNTYGFKSSRVTFTDVYYQTLSSGRGATDGMGGTNPSQIGYGAQVATIDALNTVSSATSTDRAMDVYINGDGMVAVRDVNGNTKFTRLGVLGFDALGRLVDVNGNFVLGVTMNDKGPIVNPDGSVNPDDLTIIQIDTNVLDELTGIAISDSGEIIGTMTGETEINPNKNRPAWLVDITLDRNSNGDIISDVAKNLASNLKVVMAAVSTLQGQSSADWITSIESPDNSMVQNNYSFYYDSSNKRITAVSDLDGTTYTGTYARNSTVELKDASGNVGFVIQTHAYNEPDATVGREMYETLFFDFDYEITLSGTDKAGNKYSQSMSAGSDPRGMQSTLSFSELGVTMTIDPNLMEESIRAVLDFDFQSISAHPVFGEFLAGAVIRSDSMLQNEIKIQVGKEYTGNINKATYAAINFMNQDKLAEVIEKIGALNGHTGSVNIIADDSAGAVVYKITDKDGKVLAQSNALTATGQAIAFTICDPTTELPITGNPGAVVNVGDYNLSTEVDLDWSSSVTGIVINPSNAVNYDDFLDALNALGHAGDVTIDDAHIYMDGTIIGDVDATGSNLEIEIDGLTYDLGAFTGSLPDSTVPDQPVKIGTKTVDGNLSGNSVLGSISVANKIYVLDASDTKIGEVTYNGQSTVTVGDITLQLEADELKDYFSGTPGIFGINPDEIVIGAVDREDYIDWTYSRDVASAGAGVGENFIIGQIAIATVQNMQGMTQEGDSYWTTNFNSGEASFWIPGLGGSGKLTAGYLEQSNVDISKEFTDMITTQRGFQANTRIITVSDEMLQELVNLKR